MKKIRKRSASWLAKSARRGFRGYPIATVALYGPTADLATKIAVSIIPDERKPPDVLERWFSEDIDVRHDPVVGEQILGALPRSDQLLPAVRHHHERIDGAGYPDGLGGDDIPLFARIIAVADAFVAMTSDRPYRGRLSRTEAIGILRQGAGKQWDATLVERFLPLIEKTDVESAPEARTAG